MRFLILIGGWSIGLLRSPSDIYGRPFYQHGVVRPIVIGFQPNLQMIACFRLGMGKPIVDLELNPGRGQKIQARSWYRKASRFIAPSGGGSLCQGTNRFSTANKLTKSLANQDRRRERMTNIVATPVIRKILSRAIDLRFIGKFGELLAYLIRL